MTFKLNGAKPISLNLKPTTEQSKHVRNGNYDTKNGEIGDGEI